MSQAGILSLQDSPDSPHDLHVAKFIVNSTPLAGGNYTTIASAITAASTGGVIFIMPGATGTYTENISPANLTSIVAFSGNEYTTAGPTIIGKVSLTAGSPNVSFAGLSFTTNSDYVLSCSTTATIIFENCTFNITNHDLLNITANCNVLFDNCTFITQGNFRLFVVTNTSTGSLHNGLRFENCTVYNSAAGFTLASTISGGQVVFDTCYLDTPIITSGTAGFISEFSSFNGTLNNVLPLTVGGSGTNYILKSHFLGGTASALSVAGTLTLSDCGIDSTNASAIAGAGTLFYDIIQFTNSSTTLAPTLTGGAVNIFALSLKNPLPVSSGGTGVTASDPCIQVVRSTYNTYANATVDLATSADAIPQQSASAAVTSVTITPKNAGNILEIYAIAYLGCSVVFPRGIAIFQDATANALATAYSDGGDSNPQIASILYTMTAGTTSPTTFKLQMGAFPGLGATVYINGDNTTRWGGGTLQTQLWVKEYSS